MDIFCRHIFGDGFADFKLSTEQSAQRALDGNVGVEIFVFLAIKGVASEMGLWGCKCKCSPGWRRGERPGAKGEILQIGRGGEGGGR